MKYQVFILSISAAAMLASCGKKEQAAAVATEELPIVTVDVAHRIDVPQNKVYTANVEAENINNISPATPNRITSINVEVGDRVRKGQVLVELDKSNIDQLRINLEQIEREYNRAVQLLQIGAGTQQARRPAQSPARRRQVAIRQPTRKHRAALAHYRRGDGTQLRPGRHDRGSLPVLTVGQLAPVVKVMINVSENDLATLRQGQPVDVTFDAYPGETFSGKVQRIYPTVDTATRTFEVEVRIANATEKLKPGMFARVSIDLGTQQNVVVPTAPWSSRPARATNMSTCSTATPSATSA